MSAITVIGYGSLLAEESARQTIAELRNFRLVKVAGYRRIFNKVGVVFIQRYQPASDDLRIASCATQQDNASSIIACAFECSSEEFTALYEREHRFRWIEVDYRPMLQATTPAEETVGQGRMCTEFNDSDYRLNKCVTAQEYQQRVGQYYSGKLWRNDILPFPRYLNHCLEAARSHGSDVYENFVTTTFLADQTTSIAEFLSANPSYLAGQGDYFNR